MMKYLLAGLRQDISHPSGLDLWVVADNIRKGAATNAVQIAEILQRDFYRMLILGLGLVLTQAVGKQNVLQLATMFF